MSVLFSLPTASPLPTARGCPFDPPTELGQLRAGGGLSRLVYPDGHIGWLVTSYHLARTVLADPRFSARSELKRVPVPRPGADPFIGQPALPGWLVDMDPPDHTRIRRQLAGQFTVRRMNELEPRIERVVADRLDAMELAGPPLDLMSVFALPVASLAICELLGVPYGDRGLFQHNSEVLFSLGATAAEADTAMRELTDFLLALIARKRVVPGDDLLSRLIVAGVLDDIEIAGAGVLLLTAGHETTANSLGLGTFALLSHPDQLTSLLRNPILVRDGVEELVRYLTIFHFGVPRTPLRDVELAGHLIEAGESVTISLPAANRDPERFDDPDELRLARAATGHVGFGYGVHQCLGQNLARLQLRVGYPALFGRFPALRLAVPAEEVPLGVDMGFYGVHRLPVTW